AQQDVLVCGIRSAHFPCACGGGVRKRSNGGGATVGYDPESRGLRGLRSCYRGAGLRSGAGVCVGGAAFDDGRNVPCEVAGECGIFEAGSGPDTASASFGAAEYVPVLRDEQCVPRSGESNCELCDQREWGRGCEDGKRVADSAEQHNTAADEPS